MIDKPGSIASSWVTPRAVLHAQHQALNSQGRCPVCNAADQLQHDLALHERHVRSQPSCPHDFQVTPGYGDTPTCTRCFLTISYLQRTHEPV
jgi:hypothetical protein